MKISFSLELRDAQGLLFILKTIPSVKVNVVTKMNNYSILKDTEAKYIVGGVAPLTSLLTSDRQTLE